jgi:hypothetical protein
MDQSSVPKTANLDILAKTVTDTGTHPQMRSLFAELDKAVSEATEIIGSATADEALAASGQRRSKKPNPSRFLKRRVFRSEFRLLLNDEKVLTIP